MEDKELVKMFNPTLKRRETILFYLIVVINGLTWIVLDIVVKITIRIVKSHDFTIPPHQKV